MKKINVGQIFQVLANLGVLIGILLMVYELHQNRAATQAQTRSNISEALVNLSFQQARDPQLVALLLKAQAGEPLTSVEEFQVQAHETAMWRYRENVSYQYRNGLFEEAEYLAQQEAWRELLNGNEFIRRQWCNRRRDRSSAEFVAEINALLERPCE